MPVASRPLIVLALALACVPAFATTRAKPDASTSIEPLLAGEFALQAGKLDEASASYLDAARRTGDVALASRATQIALVGKNDARARTALALWRTLAANDPSQATPLLVADATLALHANTLDAATKSLMTLLKQPGDDGWRAALSALAGGATGSKQAADVLERLVDSGQLPPVLQAWLAFGGLAQRLDRPKLAERVVNEVVKRFPGDPRVALLRASQLRDAGKAAEARAVVDGLREAALTGPDLRLAVAQEYDALGDSKAAATTLARGPQDEQTYALRAAMHAKAEDRVGLKALYDDLARFAERPDPQRRLLLGQVAEFLKQYNDALRWYDSVPGGPQRWVARLRGANVLYELGRKPDAIERLRTLQQDASAEDEVRQQAYVLEAGLWQKDKNDANENDAFARGLAAFPDEPNILYARALTFERRDDVARAEADFRRILVIEPESIAALNALGYTLADRTTRYREALELIDRARAAEPTNGAIIDSYGWVLYRLGRRDEALTELQRAYALQKDAEIAAHLGEVLWAMGRRDEAVRYFEDSRRLDPEGRSLARALKTTGATLAPVKAGDGGSTSNDASAPQPPPAPAASATPPSGNTAPAPAPKPTK